MNKIFVHTVCWFIVTGALGMNPFATGCAYGATVIAQQTDGSTSAGSGTGCNNSCSNVTVGSQIFLANVSANLGSLEIFTSNFGTASRNPDTNNCFINIFNQDTNTFLASSDNGFNGFGCAGDLVFTFNNSVPLLQVGTHYRWDYVFGGQNFSSITFAGSLNNAVGGTFSVAPLVNAKFTAFAVVAQPLSLNQFQFNGTTPIAEGGITNRSNVVLSALLPSTLPDSLQLQVELEPSFVPFKNQPNLLSAFIGSGAVASVSASSLLSGAYHWQARAIDEQGNKSLWQTISNPPASADFIVHDPSSNIVLQDNTTGYGISTQPNACFGDGTIFSCAMSPAFNNYIVSSPFSILKITFNWHNGGGNNCDGVGNYGALVTSANTTNSIVAKSTNTIYMGCAGFGAGTGGTGELDFTGQIVPASFYLTFSAFDGGLQGGSGISVSNVTIYSSFIPTQVFIVPGILGTKLQAVSNVAWLTNSQLQSAFLSTNTTDNVQIFNQLEYGDDGNPTVPLAPAGLFNFNETPLPGETLNCAGIPQIFDCLSVDTYNELRDFLTSKGYVPQPFQYDWREDLTTLSDDLYRSVSAVITDNPGARIAFVSHSMGGLIVGKMMARIGNAELPPFSAQVGPVVTLGTPFEGSVDAYLTLRGWKGLLRYIISGPASAELGKNWPSAYELLPRTNFVTVDFVNTPFPTIYDGTSTAASLFPALPRQADLPLADSFWNSPANQAVVSYRIIGTGQPTASGVLGHMNTFINAGSTPALCRLEVVRGDGDERVSITSATSQNFLPSSNLFYVQEQHIHLPSNPDVLAAIDNILIGQPVALMTSPIGVQPQWDVLTCSPVTLQLTDSAARVTNLQVQQIPGSEAFSLGESTQVSVPATGQFDADLVGTALGSFDLVFNKTDDNGQVMEQAAFIAVPVLKGSRAHLTLDDTGPGSLALDLLGTGTTDFVIAPGTQPSITTSLHILTAIVRALNLTPGVETSLATKLNNAADALERGDKQAAAGILKALSNEVSAQAGKKITASDAASLTALVTRLNGSI